MNHNHYCIIMAGGIGSRFWPVSRQARPKQFIDILGIGRTFLQMTFDRYAAIVPPENILIVTAERYADLVHEQLPQVPEENILLEPYKRNTAPCVAYATYKLYKKNPDATVVVAPSDHLIIGEESFRDTIVTALETASESDRLFTIGIDPTRPETNYGYIQINKAVSKQVGRHQSYQVKTFTEKPNADLAKVFLDTGEFFWNSGMFIWSLKAIKAEMERCLPEVTTLFRGGEEVYYTPAEKEFIQRVYGDCPAISIDYGVMEKTQKAWVFLSDFEWSDLGTWESVYERVNKGPDGTVLHGGVPMVDDVRNSIVMCDEPKKLVVVRGVEDLMVIDMADVLLVCHRDDKTVKDVVTDLTMKDKIDRYL
ncbi:MAG: mannose-1-phosphate guanylyltransferase [Bacteroidales bacterium]|jgi:mannose-1-phosphate guanylyltransferase|nr:mannose-1-phosphate guanylyltransferase [Bacteroidales bacterium]